MDKQASNDDNRTSQRGDRPAIPWSMFVTVSCTQCLHRFGTGTALGEIVSDGYEWAWAPHIRAPRPFPYEVRRWSSPGKLQTSGGIERRCRQCGYQFRSRVSRLPELAARARLKWVEESAVGPKPRIFSGWRGTVYV